MRRRTKRKTTNALRKTAKSNWRTNGNGYSRGFSFKKAYKTSVTGVKNHPYITASVGTISLAGAAGLISALILMKRH